MLCGLQEFNAKLSDYGLARVADIGSLKFGYQPPEYLATGYCVSFLSNFCYLRLGLSGGCGWWVGWGGEGGSFSTPNRFLLLTLYWIFCRNFYFSFPNYFPASVMLINILVYRSTVCKIYCIQLWGIVAGITNWASSLW